MCGIFGIISEENINPIEFRLMAMHARQRGKDSSGVLSFDAVKNKYEIIRADHDIKNIIGSAPLKTKLAMGHSRLITNGLSDNQPVMYDDVIVLHNGIVVNDEEVWSHINLPRKLQIDSEVIAAIAEDTLQNDLHVEEISKRLDELCEGTISCSILLPRLGKVILYSNNGSLYVGKKHQSIYFSSEIYPLNKINCNNVHQIINSSEVFDIPTSDMIHVSDIQDRSEDLIPPFKYIHAEEELLQYPKFEHQRCTKCILPETMPYIHFDEKGVCNYCNNYKIRNKPKPTKELFDLVAPYRRSNAIDCIVPFSGGRDSCYGLHLIVNELGMNPITYTYDWGMVTDLGRRNISRMCSKLGVENIIIAADISKKRANIRKNLIAWLKNPHLGMVSILTAGDKHFFRHVETVKEQTGINLNLWGVNPLEVTHFKAGFLGVKPDFEEDKVYSNGALKQLRYHSLRFKCMLASLGYFNSSLWDTLSGEYFRSFTKKEDYYHIFDYWKWDEELIDSTLINTYDWELAVDTNTTWRIGDGTAAFYNYIYYTVAGFTEHDTFRSNQIREGQLKREDAIRLVEDENRPRYQNIRWYLDTIGLDFTDTIKRINEISKIR